MSNRLTAAEARERSVGTDDVNLRHVNTQLDYAYEQITKKSRDGFRTVSLDGYFWGIRESDRTKTLFKIACAELRKNGYSITYSDVTNITNVSW